MRFPLPRLFAALALIVVSLTSVLPTPALAATDCTTTFEGVTIQGNLTVPDGFRCLLIDSTVTGNVTVGPRASFESYSTTIAGKVSGAGVMSVVLKSGTVVKGSVTVSGALADLLIDSSRVNGNLTLTGNSTSGDGPGVSNSTIGGNLVLSGTRASANPIFVTNNTIGGNLICDGNRFPPDGGGNAVSGRKTGQCAGL